MSELGAGRIWMIVILFATLTLILFSLRHHDRAAGNSYSFGDLLVGDDGRASKGAHVMFGAFVLTSWVIIDLTLSGKLTEGIFFAYVGAWIAPSVTSLILKRPTTTTPDKPE